MSAENHNRVTNPQAGGMVKQIHKRDCISVTLATIVLISLYAGCANPLVNAAGGNSATNVRASALVGTTVTSAPAACAQNANSVDLFAKGTDGALWYTSSQGSAWSAWQSLGGTLTSDPAAASRNLGGITVFVRGTDGTVYYRDYVGGSWGPWASIGGQVAVNTGPAACSWGGGRLDVFVEGINGGLYQKTYTPTGGWSGWQSLGGSATSSPAATSRNTGGLTVFVRGSDGGIYYRDYVGGSWGPWASIGGQVAVNTGPAACSWGGGRLDVFVEGINGGLYQKTYTPTGGWSGWQSLGGSATSSPAAASPASGAIDVFVRGTDGTIWEKTYNSAWSGWTSIGGVSLTETPTIYYVPQEGSTWVNQGTAGASYNAYVSTPSSFQTQSNGYPYWADTGTSSFICIPAGAATNNQNVVSWEIGFHFAGIASGQRYQKIWDKAAGGFAIYIDTYYGADSSLLTIYRATTVGHARWYIPTDTVLRAGHNYYIQIAWNTSAGPGHEPYPTVWIGEDGKAPVHQTDFDESGGALGGTGSWYNDAVGGANLGNTASDVGTNTSAKLDPLDGGFFVYRQFNSIVDFSNGGNWNTDKLAWT